MPRPPVPVASAGIPEEELADRTPSLWLRFLSGSVLIISAVAAAVAATGILFLGDLAAEIRPLPGVQKQLDQVDPGAPQTIMIIGSDRRADTDKKDKRSDTTMLVRVDPGKEVLSLFSLPRDLKVEIPGVGIDKLNAAYTAGGSKLTVETVKAFMDVEVNHVVEINFNGFADAVNAIDCVYIDVDRDYFNVNDGSVDNDYAEIDINAGYQRLCGLKALQYVRYRHTDSDLVRAARQQDFLREARQKVQPRELLGAINPLSSGGTGNELIEIFTDYTRSDIDDKADVIGILKSFAAMRNVPVNEVHFQGDIGGPDNPYVTSSDRQVEKAKDEFLNGVGSKGQRGGEEATDKDGDDKKQKKKKKKDKDPTAGANVVDTSALADQKFPTLADRFAADAAKNARRLEIPVFYPTRVVPGSSFDPGSRTYEYKNEDDKKESGYKTVISYQPAGLTEYYGVMGTTWDDPPILRNPSETRKIGGREYLLFYDGGRLRLVGWKEKGNSYWLNNTLVQSIGEAEMLAIATTMREV
jgi:LCP family protein required for cell wall assembly